LILLHTTEMGKRGYEGRKGKVTHYYFLLQYLPMSLFLVLADEKSQRHLISLSSVSLGNNGGFPGSAPNYVGVS